MLEDLPVVDLQVTGDHVQAGGICFIGFLFPFLTPPEASNVRAILPLDTAEPCVGQSGFSPEDGDSSTTEEGVTEPIVGDDAVESEPNNDKEDTDGLGFVGEEVPSESESAASSSFGGMGFTFLLSMSMVSRLWTL